MGFSRVVIAALCVVALGGETVGTTADLTLAKKRKKDEFYTQLVDIENELKHYKEHFKDKVVLCNCDDPRKSNFAFEEMRGDHIKPWSKGGKTVPENL